MQQNVQLKCPLIRTQCPTWTRTQKMTWKFIFVSYPNLCDAPEKTSKTQNKHIYIILWVSQSEGRKKSGRKPDLGKAYWCLSSTSLIFKRGKISSACKWFLKVALKRHHKPSLLQSVQFLSCPPSMDQNQQTLFLGRQVLKELDYCLLLPRPFWSGKMRSGLGTPSQQQSPVPGCGKEQCLWG